MKIEKINENQIRCTLTMEDLAERHIKISEIAYGTDNAKALFSEMLRWASYKFGFEAEDMPLMIEAVPITNESIMLIVTKVEYPEELDTRFSKFTETDGDYDDLDDLEDLTCYDDDSCQAPAEDIKPSSASDIIDLFRKAKAVAEGINRLKEASGLNTSEEESPIDITKLYVFNSLETIIDLAHVLGDYYHGENAVYKNNKEKVFYLIVSKSDHSPEEFNKVCNIISEYGTQDNLSVGSEAYFAEHYHPIILHNALETLSKI